MKTCLFVSLLFLNGLKSYANNAFDLHCPQSNKVRQISSKANGKLSPDKQKKAIEDINDILLQLKKDFPTLTRPESKKLYQRCYNSYFTSAHNLISKAPYNLQIDPEFNEIVGDYFFLDGNIKQALIHFDKSESLKNDRYQLQYKIISCIAELLKDPHLNSSKVSQYALRVKKIYKTLMYNESIPASDKRKFSRNFWYLEK